MTKQAMDEAVAQRTALSVCEKLRLDLQGRAGAQDWHSICTLRLSSTAVLTMAAASERISHIQISPSKCLIHTVQRRLSDGTTTGFLSRFVSCRSRLPFFTWSAVKPNRFQRMGPLAPE